MNPLDWIRSVYYQHPLPAVFVMMVIGALLLGFYVWLDNTLGASEHPIAIIITRIIGGYHCYHRRRDT